MYEQILEVALGVLIIGGAFSIILIVVGLLLCISIIRRMRKILGFVKKTTERITSTCIDPLVSLSTIVEKYTSKGK